MLLFAKLLWWKWVLRGCPHVCAWCRYRCRCWPELFHDLPFQRKRRR